MSALPQPANNLMANALVTASPNGGQGMNPIVAQQQSKALAEVQGAVAMAKHYPRNQMQSLDRILNACQRPTLAENAVYAYSKGGSEITGPSIRLAEAIAQQWGNFDFGVRELEQRPGISTMEAYAWDIETNVRRTMQFQVEHKRKTKKKGVYSLDDPREIYELTANQGSRRVRACILALIPGDVVEEAVKQCENTLKTNADNSPEAVQRMIEAFAAYGVSKEMIEKRIQRRTDSILPAQILSLRKIYASIKDGMGTLTDFFEKPQQAESPEGKTQTEQVKDKLKANTTKPAVTEPEQPPAEAKPDKPATKPSSKKPKKDEQTKLVETPPPEHH